jgi:hypothetical protein
VQKYTHIFKLQAQSDFFFGGFQNRRFVNQRARCIRFANPQHPKPHPMLSPATFDSVLISKLDEDVVMPVDLVIWSADNRQLFHDRIFTVRRVIQPTDLAPGLYRITMTNEHGLVHEGYYSKVL